jgi:hypothetical protein
VARFLATVRFIGFFFAFALVFIAVLAMCMPSLFSLVRISSNLSTLNNFERLVDSEGRFKDDIYRFSTARVAASPHFSWICKLLQREMQRETLFGSAHCRRADICNGGWRSFFSRLAANYSANIAILLSRLCQESVGASGAHSRHTTPGRLRPEKARTLPKEAVVRIMRGRACCRSRARSFLIEALRFDHET